MKNNIISDPLQVVIDQRIKQRREDITLSNAKNNATTILIDRCPASLSFEEQVVFWQKWLKIIYTTNLKATTPKKEVKQQVKKDVRQLLKKAHKKINNGKIIQQSSLPIVRPSKA